MNRKPEPLIIVLACAASEGGEGAVMTSARLSLLVAVLDHISRPVRPRRAGSGGLASGLGRCFQPPTDHTQQPPGAPCKTKKKPKAQNARPKDPKPNKIQTKKQNL